MASQKTSFKTAKSHPDAPQVLNVEPREVWENRHNLTLIDVREPHEYEGELGHIANSELIVLSTLPEHIQELPTDRTLVFICRSGGRSAQATAFALANGLEDCYNMQGGMLKWNELKLETEGKS